MKEIAHPTYKLLNGSVQTVVYLYISLTKKYVCLCIILEASVL